MPRVSTHIGTLNSVRTSNYLLPKKVDETHITLARLADGMQLCTPEGHKEISNAVGKIQLTITQEEGVVKVIRSLKLAKQLITPADYAAFRRLAVEWEDAKKGTLLVKGK